MRTLFLERPEHVPRWTSGRESWVFHADSPDRLCGYHPQLIRASGVPDEFEYLLYSPFCEGTEGPFRAGSSGSHAVGITPSQLVVSRDPHAEAPPRSVTTIELDDVSCLEIGCALLLGWLVIRVHGPEAPGACAVSFGSQGIRHFRALVRLYRRRGRMLAPWTGSEREWSEVWDGSPVPLRTELEPLIEEAERPLAVLRSPERWRVEKRFWRSRSRCTSAPGLLVATPRGMLWAASEPRRRSEDVAFGVSVTVARAERVAAASIGERDGLGVLCLRAGEGVSGHEMEVLFDGKDVAEAEAIVQLVRLWRERE